MIDYPMRLGQAIAGLRDIKQNLAVVLNRMELSDETNQALQDINAHISEVLRRVNTET